MKDQTSGKCIKCGGWINPPWKRGDGDYKHCECAENLREHESLETWIEVLHSDLRSEGIDTSLNWLLLKKI